MKTIPWRFYITLALTAGFGPAVGFGSAIGTAWHSFWVGVIGGLLVGVLCVAWCAVWYRRVMQKRDPTFTLADAGSHREATLELPLDAGEAFEICLEILNGMPGFYATTIDRMAGRINGLTGGGGVGYLSFGSPGERISVEIAARGPGSSEVKLRSRPGTIFVVLDFGKNRENINTIAREFNAAIQKRFVLAREATERSDMERALAEARLSALEAHIEPHFLYNTLANAQLLTRSDPARADLMLGNLITYLRTSLPQTGRSSSTLGRELERSQAYLDILKIRMGARLAVSIDVPAALASLSFPPMMLQTLVENAVKHGLEPKPGGGMIRIAANVGDGQLTVSVSDNGLGLREGSSGTGLGLRNIRERLQLSYGDAATFTLRPNAEQGLDARIVMPVSQLENASWPPR